MNKTSHQHIELRPSDTHGELPYIVGTRLRVLDIYVWHVLQGMTANEIVDQHPQLTMADVYAAMTYYWDHREEVQEQLRRAKEVAEANRPAGRSLTLPLPGTIATDVNPVSS